MMEKILFEIAMAILFMAIASTKRYKVLAIAGGVSIALILLAINYFLLPVKRVGFYPAMWIEFIVVGAIAYLVYRATPGHDKKIWAMVPLLLGVCGLLVMSIFSMECFRAQAYSNLLKVRVKPVSALNGVPVLLEKQMNMNEAIAQKIAQDKLTEYSEKFELGKPYVQILNGEFEIQQKQVLKFENDLVFVLPLFPKDDSVTGGYIIVSSNQHQKAFLVTEVSGKAIYINYTENSSWGKKIERKIYANGGSALALAEKRFYVSHDGKPFWILPVYEHEVGFSGKNLSKIIQFNPDNGKFSCYALDDHETTQCVQPKEFVEEQINWWGTLSEGWWNSIFGENSHTFLTSKLVPTYYNGKIYWGADVQMLINSKVEGGILLVDASSKEAILFVSDVAAASYGKAHPVKKAEPAKKTTKVTEKVELPSQSVSSSEHASGRYAQMIEDNVKASKTVKQKKYVYVVNSLALEGDIYFLRFDEIPDVEFIGTSKYFSELKWTYPGELVTVGAIIDPKTVSYDKESGTKLVPMTFFDNAKVNLMNASKVERH